MSNTKDTICNQGHIHAGGWGVIGQILEKVPGNSVCCHLSVREGIINPDCFVT